MPDLRRTRKDDALEELLAWIPRDATIALYGDTKRARRIFGKLSHADLRHLLDFVRLVGDPVYRDHVRHHTTRGRSARKNVRWIEDAGEGEAANDE